MTENHDPVVVEDATPEGGGCPVAPGLTHPTKGDANREWWPNKLNLKILARPPPWPTPWANSSTTPRRSRPSTSLP